MKSSIIIFAILFLGCLHMNPQVQVENTSITGQRFSGSVTIDAEKESVWNVLTDADQLFEFMNYTYLSGTKRFSAPGDVTRLEDWGDHGTLVLMHVEANQELRMGFEPDNATYFCTQRWRLAEEGSQTIVQFDLKYTESGTQTEEAVQEQVQFYEDVLTQIKSSIKQ